MEKKIQELFDESRAFTTVFRVAARLTVQGIPQDATHRMKTRKARLLLNTLKTILTENGFDRFGNYMCVEHFQEKERKRQKRITR